MRDQGVRCLGGGREVAVLVVGVAGAAIEPLAEDLVLGGQSKVNARAQRGKAATKGTTD